MSDNGQDPQVGFRLHEVPEHAELLCDGITGILKGMHEVL